MDSIKIAMKVDNSYKKMKRYPDERYPFEGKANSTIDVKLRTSSCWFGAQTGAVVTATLVESRFVAAHGAMDIGGSIWARSKALSLAYNGRETQDK